MRETRKIAPIRSPYPRISDEIVPDKAKPITPEFLAAQLDNLFRHISDATMLIEDKSHRVDEYQVTALSPLDQVTTVTLQPDYEVSEIIESIIVTGPTSQVPTPGTSATASGNVAAPGAGAVIASVSSAQLQAISPGLTLWAVNWSVTLEGTLAAADANNMKIASNLVTVENAEMPAVAGEYPQPSFQWQLASLGGGFTVQAIGTATAGSVYGAEITATPLLQLPPFTLKLGKRVWNLLLPSSGILLISPVRISLDRGSDRFLTSAVPGDWAVELTGHADYRGSYRYK